MIYDLVSGSDPILKESIEPFDFQNPSVDPIEFAHNLAQSMMHHNGIGLSANQVGFKVRAFAIKANPILVMYNPKIVHYSPECNYLEEGCLSFPGYWVKIKRSSEIRIRYTQPNGTIKTEKFTGMTARCILHEYDHLDGIVYWKRANTFHREQALRRAKLARRKSKSE